MMQETQSKEIVALTDVLSPWERKFCEWLVEKYPSSVKKTDSAKACSALAGREVTVKELNTLRQRRAFRRYYTEVRIASQDLKNEGLAIYQETVPDAMRLQQKAVQQMLSDKSVDIRAVPSIVAPFNDYVAPKKHVGEVQATAIIVNLTVNQAQGLDTPAFEVEAQEVEYETIP